MKTLTSRTFTCLCLALALGCGESETPAGGSLDKLKDAGQQMGSDLKDAGSKLGAELADAGKTLDTLIKDAAAGISLKGDKLATGLNEQLPQLEKIYDGVKKQLEAKGGAMKDMVPALKAKLDAAKSSIATLAKSGAEAATDVKQAAIDAFSGFAKELKAAVTKLQG